MPWGWFAHRALLIGPRCAAAPGTGIVARGRARQSTAFDGKRSNQRQFRALPFDRTRQVSDCVQAPSGGRTTKEEVAMRQKIDVVVLLSAAIVVTALFTQEGLGHSGERIRGYNPCHGPVGRFRCL